MMGYNIEFIPTYLKYKNIFFFISISVSAALRLIDHPADGDAVKAICAFFAAWTFIYRFPHCAVVVVFYHVTIMGF